MSRPDRTPRSSSGTQSESFRGVTAIFTTPVLRDCIACSCPVRSAGTPSKSCIDNTTRRRASALAIRSSKRERHSTSTYSAPNANASARIWCRSSSDPAKCPPSQVGRHVTITGRRRSASAPAALGSLTVSSRSSIRSASATASRLRRSSAVVVAVTVTQSRVSDIKKASSAVGLKRLESFARWQVRPRRTPLQSGRNTTTRKKTA